VKDKVKVVVWIMVIVRIYELHKRYVQHFRLDASKNHP